MGIELENATIYWNDPKLPLPSPKLGENDDESKSNLDTSRHSTTSSKHSAVTGSESEMMESGSLSAAAVRYPKAIVHNISLKVQPGQLCAVVGRVGSGKSTLCSALLNEVELGDGSKITLRGSIAY